MYVRDVLQYYYTTYYYIILYILLKNMDGDHSHSRVWPTPLAHRTTTATTNTNTHSMHGRLSMKKANIYKKITIIWSCTTMAHADLGTRRIGSIHWRQYIVKAVLW